ncbi:2-C-methyl-D-erythritol 4-phosphate cytidylyltransferase [Psychromonas sp. MB-3u-54]|uniref:2-C-methyl-D-erythritol 4-phosphate cytidylyltransferase n=1 Tax=Psychromonas sp. MB-3u-54 TaxID=2058319 RepID=UPI000C32CD36|nr:2-C-methyl-D-erythritol 4-phosphate cytidylyltransferase [Psychromonas sp. MB-3u-54]PKH03982.1 2-C-methyl-D-erythritol 4-phosphate cytidylyltransferase [Psychromonas sp. MB-3u-54]
MSRLNLNVVIAAAGIGKRVGANIPKQYLPLLGKTIIEHSIAPFLNHPDIKKVIVSIAENDLWFAQLALAENPKIQVVIGGKERVDSVLCALKVLPEEGYVLVHDAARPCIKSADIDKLINTAVQSKHGAILGARVRDTIKRSDPVGHITHTVSRTNLWHALTPQMFENKVLINAIESAEFPEQITDEASAMEMAGLTVAIIEGRSDNLKVTREEDLTLAELYLSSSTSK